MLTATNVSAHSCALDNVWRVCVCVCVTPPTNGPPEDHTANNNQANQPRQPATNRMFNVCALAFREIQLFYNQAMSAKSAIFALHVNRN